MESILRKGAGTIYSYGVRDWETCENGKTIIIIKGI
jgi:hypothetical protein